MAIPRLAFHAREGRVGGGGCENHLSRFRAREGFVVGRKGGGGCETPPSRVLSEGAACSRCETPPSRVSSEGGVCGG